MARRRGIFRSRGQKTPTDWIAFASPTQATLTSDGDPQILNTLSITDPGIGTQTIVRVRGSVYFRHAAGAVGEQFVAAGLCLCLDQEVNAGVTAMPHPIADADDDRWMWHRSTVVGRRVGPGNTADIDDLFFDRAELDSKAMRKWDNKWSICLIGENDSLSGTAQSVFGSAWVRVLLKAH